MSAAAIDLGQNALIALLFIINLLHFRQHHKEGTTP